MTFLDLLHSSYQDTLLYFKYLDLFNQVKLDAVPVKEAKIYLLAIKMSLLLTELLGPCFP